MATNKEGKSSKKEQWIHFFSVIIVVILATLAALIWILIWILILKFI